MYGMLYGQGVASLAKELDLSTKEASNFLKAFRQVFLDLQLFVVLIF
jgi:DNA polymerase I-like protein with 3'-5' exonuclease and polymerase domains